MEVDQHFEREAFGALVGIALELLGLVVPSTVAIDGE